MGRDQRLRWHVSMAQTPINDLPVEIHDGLADRRGRNEIFGVFPFNVSSYSSLTAVHRDKVYGLNAVLSETRGGTEVRKGGMP